MACKFDDKIVIVATTLKFKIFVCFKFKVGRLKLSFKVSDHIVKLGLCLLVAQKNPLKSSKFLK